MVTHITRWLVQNSGGGRDSEVTYRNIPWAETHMQPNSQAARIYFFSCPALPARTRIHLVLIFSWDTGATGLMGRSSKPDPGAGLAGLAPISPWPSGPSDTLLGRSSPVSFKASFFKLLHLHFQVLIPHHSSSTLFISKRSPQSPRSASRILAMLRLVCRPHHVRVARNRSAASELPSQDEHCFTNHHFRPKPIAPTV